MLELDVHLSRDGIYKIFNLVTFNSCFSGEVVVAHDQELHRLTGLDQKIRNLDFAQLPLLQDSVTIDFCPGLVYNDDSVREQERNFSTLGKVLQEFPSTQVNIDLKDKDKTLVELVNKIIVENNAEGSMVRLFSLKIYLLY